MKSNKSNKKGNSLSLFLNLVFLVGAVLGLTAFILHFTNKGGCGEGYKHEEKVDGCHVNHKSCLENFPEPALVKNLSELENFWKSGDYKFSNQRLPAKNYPSGFKSDGILEVHYEENQLCGRMNENRKFEKDGKEQNKKISFNVTYTLSNDGRVKCQINGTSGGTRNGFYVSIGRDENSIFYKGNSETTGKKLFYLEVNRKKGGKIESNTYITDDLNKQWVLAYSQVFEKQE